MKRSRPWLLVCVSVVLLLLLAGAGAAVYKFAPLLDSLMEPARMQAFEDWLRSFGFVGALALVGIQTLQVLSGIVPALPIQLAAGLTYGALPGLLLCLAGITAGSTIVFLAIKRYGRPLLDKLVPPEKQARLSFLSDSKKLEPIVFLLYFIPALPKDVFTYLAGLTPLSLGRYLTITLVARIPTIFCTTFASHAFMEGAYMQAILVFCITGTLGILSMLLSGRLMRAVERFSKK